MINVGVHLYGKPAWDMNIEGEEDIDPDMLRTQGVYLREHLDNVARIVEKLNSTGWRCYGTLYSLEFSKEGISKGQAEKELKKLGVLDEVNIEEFEEEFEE